MSDYWHFPSLKAKIDSGMVNSEGKPKLCLAAAIPKPCPEKVMKKVTSMDQKLFHTGTAVEIGWFLLKMATLEALRRFSKAHCPLAWHGLQALQVICYSPFKWIERWAPLRFLVKCMQTLSRPLLLLSVATSVSDWSSLDDDTSRSSDNSQAYGDPQSSSSGDLTTPDSRSAAGATKSLASEKWMSRLFSELQKEGIILPERIDEDELCRFYDATNRDFSSFLSAVKKTVQWRQKFKFLSSQDLEDWSTVVFWHGCDKKRRPCLFVRLGLACSPSAQKDIRCLPEVVVSQIEHGVLNLVDAKDREITVVMDCEGLTPFRFPMQTMRSCAILLQDHYPNHLAALFVIRLPPIARVIVQTLFQVVRPGTRKKLRIEGDYQKVLLELLESLPSFLGGECSCPRCAGPANTHDLTEEEGTDVAGPSTESTDSQTASSQIATLTDNKGYMKCKRALKAAFISSLVLLCIAFFLATHSSLIRIRS